MVPELTISAFSALIFKFSLAKITDEFAKEESFKDEAKLPIFSELFSEFAAKKSVETSFSRLAFERYIFGTNTEIPLKLVTSKVAISC